MFDASRVISNKKNEDWKSFVKQVFFQYYRKGRDERCKKSSSSVTERGTEQGTEWGQKDGFILWEKQTSWAIINNI